MMFNSIVSLQSICFQDSKRLRICGCSRRSNHTRNAAATSISAPTMPTLGSWLIYTTMKAYVNLSWIGLSWIELNWVEHFELSWSEWVGFNWAELSCIDLSWTELSWVGLSWCESSWSQLTCIGLRWIESSWVEVSCVEFGWVEWVEWTRDVNECMLKKRSIVCMKLPWLHI